MKRNSVYLNDTDLDNIAVIQAHDGDRGFSSLVTRLLAQRAGQIRGEKVNRYSVTVKPNTDPTEPGAFVALNRFDPEAVIDLVDTDADGNEIYEIETKHDIDRILDTSPGVITYERK